MATQSWLGNAPAIAQVISIVVGGTAATGQTYSIKMGLNNAKVVAYTWNGSDTNTQIATALQALLASTLFPEFLEVLWTNPSAGTILATGQTAGVPFTITCTASGTGTLTPTTTTANSGPSDVAIASNWSQGTLPVTGDQIFLQNNSVPLLYNLQQLGAITPALFQADSSNTAAVGLPATNSNGYREYRTRFLQFTGCTNVMIGQGGGQSSGKIMLDFQSGTYAAEIYNAASSTETGVPAIQLKGGSGSSSCYVAKGTVGLALIAGETAQTALVMDYVNNQASDSQLTTGAGCTLVSVEKNGGVLNAYSDVPGLTSYAGVTTVYTGSMSTVNLYSANVKNPPQNVLYYNGGGTITNNTVEDGCTLDLSGSNGTVTLTNSTWYAGSTINAPAGNVAMTNAASIPDGQASDVKANLGVNRTLKVA